MYSPLKERAYNTSLLRYGLLSLPSKGCAVVWQRAVRKPDRQTRPELGDWFLVTVSSYVNNMYPWCVMMKMTLNLCGKSAMQCDCEKNIRQFPVQGHSIVFLTSNPYCSQGHQNQRKVWETVTAKGSLCGHGNKWFCGVLDGILEGKEVLLSFKRKEIWISYALT